MLAGVNAGWAMTGHNLGVPPCTRSQMPQVIVPGPDPEPFGPQAAAHAADHPGQSDPVLRLIRALARAAANERFGPMTGFSVSSGSLIVGDHRR